MEKIRHGQGEQNECAGSGREEYMMIRMYQVLTRRMLGARYEKAVRSALAGGIVFWGLYTAGVRIPVAPFILYLMFGTVTAGVMWKALETESRAEDLKHLLMLPFDNRKLMAAYTAALGTWTFFTRTGLLLAVVLAVRPWKRGEFAGCMLCVTGAVCLTVLFWLAKQGRMDAWAFCPAATVKRFPVKAVSRPSVCVYLVRYLLAHRNYLTNTAALWGIACVLPFFFRAAGGTFLLPVGFAVLSLNTPLQILLSCDPSLERMIRFLPDQGRTFFFPYGCFLFLCSLVPYSIYLLSFAYVNGGVTAADVLLGIWFALQGAAGAVYLEARFPIRNRKVESDLWHHPRKYVIPALLMLEAAMIQGLCR